MKKGMKRYEKRYEKIQRAFSRIPAASHSLSTSLAPLFSTSCIQKLGWVELSELKRQLGLIHSISSATTLGS